MASAAYENSRNLLNEPPSSASPYKESKIHDGFPVTEETAKYLALHRLLMVNPNDDPIELAPSRYEAWRKRFAEERDRIYDSLATDGLDRNIEHVEHVGSTAIPDLAAKDIVDIDVIVADDAVASISQRLEAELGGTRLENTDSWHPLFRVHDGQRFNDHVFAVSGNKWKVSVVTRDVLRKHADLRTEYEQLKRESSLETTDLTTYSRNKTAFIEHLLQVGQDDDDLEFNFAVPTDPQV